MAACAPLVALSCTCGGAPGSFSGTSGLHEDSFIGLKAFFDRYEYPSLLESDRFFRLELEGRYEISRTLAAQVRVPYLINHRLGFDPVQGLGDAQLGVRWIPFKRSGMKTLHKVATSVAMELPSGRFALPSEEVMPRALSTGSGSWDLRLGAAYLAQRGSNGLAAEFQYAANTANGQGYRFGNRAAASLLVFRTFGAQKRLTPFAGVAYESKENDIENGEPIFGNSGSELLAQGGLQFSTRKMSLTGKCDVPLISDMQISTKHRPRVFASIIFFINSRN